MPINSKQKGNRFERDIANILSNRFKNLLDKDQSFRRNADSGSFWGGKNMKRKETHDTDYAIYGDLVCPRGFNFTVECKNYKTSPPLNGLLIQKIPEWDTWLSQARQDSEQCGKDYLLIIKYNRTEILCLIDKKFVNSTCNLEIFTYTSCIGITLSELLKLDDLFFFKDWNDDTKESY